MNQIKSTYLPILSHKWLTPVAAASALFALGTFTTPALALGLSKITVKSHIGEPLNAEVKVIALKPKEAESIKARIADPSAFGSTGMTYNRALSGARVSVESRGGSTYLKIKGFKPVKEPFLDLVLNVRSDKGGLVRGYTMLIDPISKPAAVTSVAPAPAPVYSAPTPSHPSPAPATQTPTYAAPAPVYASPNNTGLEPATVYLDDGTLWQGGANNVQPKITTQPVYTEAKSGYKQPAKRKSKRRTQRRRSAIGKQTLGSDVRVVRGDTASELAARNARAAGVSLDQMLAAMLQENPDAFINGDINRLKAGAVLNMPTQSVAQSVSHSEARQILASSKNFRSYRRKLAASDAVTSTPKQERKTTGKVTTEVTDRSEADTTDKLTLSKTTQKTGNVSTGKPSKEEAAAATTQKQDAETRVAELKKNIEELEKLAKATPTPKAPIEDSIPEVPGLKVPATGETVAAAVEDTVDEMVDTTVNATGEAIDSTTDAVEAGAETVTDAADSLVTPAEEAVQEAKEAVADASEAVQGAIPELDTPPIEVATPATTTTPESPGIMDTVMDNIVPIGGGLLALLGLGGGLAYMRRRKKSSDGADSAFIESRIGPDSFFDASGGQSIDTASRPGGVISSSMVYSPSQLDAGGDVDPVAEADVYLAYNRDVQAEEILKEAMRITPSRVAIYTKLMEIYAQRGDVKAFDVVAREAHHLTGGQGEEWEKAAELGQKVDPQNPLYQGTGAASPAASPVNSLDDNWEDKPQPFATATAPMAIDPVTTNSGPAELTNPTGSMDLDLGDVFESSTSSGSTPLEVPADMAYTEASLSGNVPLGSTSGSAPLASAVSAPSPIAPQADDGGLSFDLSDTFDGGSAGVAAADNTFSADATQPLSTPDVAPSGFEGGLSLDLADQSGESSLDMTFDSAPMQLGSDTTPSQLDFSDSDTAASLISPDSTTDGTSWETKLMLAEEFKTLGDTDGARMMAQEVVDNASGDVKSQAEQFIAGL